MELKTDYKATSWGVIPHDWKIVCLSDLVENDRPISYGIVQTGKNISNGIKCVRVVDLINGFIDNSNLITTTPQISDSYKRTVLKEGDLVIALRGKIGEVAYVDNSLEGANLTRGVAIIATKKEYNSNFIKQQLSSKHQKNIFENNLNGSALKELALSVLRKIEIALPPIKAEQTAIATALSDSDELIASLKKLIAKKRMIKQGVMQKLLTPKEDWEVKKLGEISDICTGKKNNQDKVINGEYPFFVRSQNIERINSYSYDGEAILVPGEGNIGKIFHYINGKFDYHQRVYKISDFAKGNSGKYIYRYMTEFFGKHAMENSVKATVDSLRLPTFEVFEIPFPPKVEEQIEIATTLSDMDSEIEALETKLAKYRQIKQGMMQQLLTGKIRLIKPKSKVHEEELAAAAETTANYKKVEKKHNEHINDAVLIGTMAKEFGSEEFPLTRFMYTKVSYLLKRYKEERDEGYLKKAAGPYKPQTRYGGAETIALNRKYVKTITSTYQGKKYENFLADDNSGEAVGYFRKWYGEDALEWIRQFKFVKRNQLELWATVDMAMEDLKRERKLVNVETVKQLINNHKEWRPKLKRPVFSDENIKAAIIKSGELFG